MKEESLSVMVLTHNNENTIQACLEGILNGGISDTELIHVVINGSTDRTKDIVMQMVSVHKNIKPVILKIGDRANAWNHYVYNIATPQRHHVFIDADVVISKNSLTAIKSAISLNKEALAFSTLPLSGIRRKKWQHKILIEKAMFGNFYCLRSSTVERMKNISFRIPQGYFCDDAFTTWALLRNLQQQNNEDLNLICPVTDSGFYHEPLNCTTPNGIKMHLKRHYRFAVRNIQSNLLADHVMKHGYFSIPEKITDLHDCKAILLTARRIFRKPEYDDILFPIAAFRLCKY